jgi:FkbM family methyltransferase
MVLNPFIADESRRAGLAPCLIDTQLLETYSQAGEDLIVESLLAVLNAKAPPADSLFYMEIGANHPVQTSNTYLLYRKYGSAGVLVDADPELIPALKKGRPRDQVVHAAVSDRRDATVTLHVANAKELSSLDLNHVQAFGHLGELATVSRAIQVPNIHINDLLAKHAARPLHYLSIDVEGVDLAIMRAMDFETYRPRVLSCEPSGHIYANNPQQMFDVMVQAGYALVARTFVNMIFVDKRWL